VCGVIREAAIVICTEGGPAHFARAFRTPALVLFGPTPLSLFGCPENVNLQSRYHCVNCAWTHGAWYSRCLHRPAGDPSACMAQLSPEEVWQFLPTMLTAQSSPRQGE